MARTRRWPRSSDWDASGCMRSASGLSTPAAAGASTSPAPTRWICRPRSRPSAVSQARPHRRQRQAGQRGWTRPDGYGPSYKECPPPGIDSVSMSQLSTPAAGSPGKSFVHLHVHTEYSMLDGAARIDELFETAVRMGMPALATTDHGYIFGAYEFWSKAKKYGIKPIIGLEAYQIGRAHV